MRSGWCECREVERTRTVCRVQYQAPHTHVLAGEGSLSKNKKCEIINVAFFIYEQ